MIPVAIYSVSEIRLDEAAWLACAVDGEGWIGLYTNRKWPVVEVGVTNTSVPFLQCAATLMGGRIRGMHCSTGIGRKAMFRVSVKGHLHVLSVLKTILPYLIIKKEKALEVVRFIENRAWGMVGPRGRANQAAAAQRVWADPEYRTQHLIKRHGTAVCRICGDAYFAKGFCAYHYNKDYNMNVRVTRGKVVRGGVGAVASEVLCER